MEDKPGPELADLDEGSSKGTPTTRGLRDFADPADIATVFDRLGYQPPSSTAATPTPAIRSRISCSHVSSWADLDSLPSLPTGGGKTTYWASFLPHLLSAEDNRIFASGSYAHGTIVQAVSELLHDLTDGHHHRNAAAPPATHHHCLPEHLSVLWTTSTFCSRDVDTGWADTLRYLRRCWNEASRWPSPSDARFLLLLQPATGWDCSPTGFDDRLCAALRGAYAETLPPDRGADLIVRSNTGVFVIQAKTTARSKRRNDELDRKRATRMWLMCAGDKSDDDATVFELSGATEKDWLEEPIRATRLTSLSA